STRPSARARTGTSGSASRGRGSAGRSSTGLSPTTGSGATRGTRTPPGWPRTGIASSSRASPTALCLPGAPGSCPSPPTPPPRSYVSAAAGHHRSGDASAAARWFEMAVRERPAFLTDVDALRLFCRWLLPLGYQRTAIMATEWRRLATTLRSALSGVFATQDLEAEIARGRWPPTVAARRAVPPPPPTPATTIPGRRPPPPPPPPAHHPAQ